MTTPGSPARRRMPRLAAALAALTLAAALLAPGAAVAAPSPSPTPTPTATPSVAPGTTVFTLSPVANGIVRPGEPLGVSVSLQNGTDAELAAVGVTLSLGAAPLRNRQELTAWLDGDGTTDGLQTIGSTTLEAVAPASERIASITVAAEDPALAGRGAGVYPLAASYTTPVGTVTSTSAMIVPAADGREVGVGVVVPITAGAGTDGVLAASELTELTAVTGELTEQLDAVEGTPAILAVDPLIVASIRVLGSAAPLSAVEWLARLERMPNSRFALQYGDADVTAQLESGLPRPLQPTSFVAYTDPADFPEPSPTPTPTPTPGATGAPDEGSATPTPAATTDAAAPGGIPDTAELLSIGAGARDAVYWPADGTAGPAVVAQLGTLGVDTTSSLTVVPSTTTAAGADGDTVPAHAAADEAGLLVYDSEISAALAAATAHEESWLRGAPLTAATAYLTFATASTDGPLLVSVGRSADRSRLGLSTAIATATETPGASPRALTGIIASEPVRVSIVDAVTDPARAGAASALVADEEEIGRFATILDQPALLTGEERVEILRLLGVAWIAQEAWPTALADHRTATQSTLGSVALLPTTPSDLYGSNAALRFWVRNDLPYPVNLVLYTTPSNLRLDVQGETPVVATPDSNTRVDVPVQARVGRGEVTLSLQLRSPAFVAVGPPETVELNVWAEWEAYGLTALGVVVGGLLLFGIVRTVLKVRRRRQRTDAAPERPGEQS